MIKIVGGKYRSRNIETPPESITLPTKNRVREALASALTNDIPGAKVLDLFAGSGALSFEALSRGAESALLVDANQEAYRVIMKNAASLKERGAEIWNLDYLAALQKAKGRQFSLVFLDPPYALKEAYQKAVSYMLDNHMLSKGCAIVLEYEGEIPFDGSPFDEVRHYTYGKSKVSIYRGIL